MLVLHSDQMLTCPLDEAHRIRKERMQFHLVKCAKNHTLQQKVKCPWNPLHIIDKFKWQKHWTNECENLPANVDFFFETEELKEVRIAPVDTTRVVFEGGEDWDAEPWTAGTYDPVKSSENKPILRLKIGLSKAKKKEWRQAERKRIQDLEANGPLQLDKLHNKSQAEKSINVSGPLRQPRQKAVALSVNDSTIDSLNSSRPSVIEEKKTTMQEIFKLRKPHAPSPAMSMNAETSKSKIVSDETFSVTDRDSVASGGANVRSTVDPNTDAASMTSSRCTDLELGRQGFATNFDAGKDTDEEIVQRFADLTTIEKDIKDKKTAILQHMVERQSLPNLVNPKSSKGSSILENGSDRATFSGQEPMIPALITGKTQNLTRPLGKCAAFFPTLNEALHSSSAERGATVDLAAFGKRSSAKKKGADNTSRGYAASYSSMGESSAFGYEEVYD